MNTCMVMKVLSSLRIFFKNENIPEWELENKLIIRNNLVRKVGTGRDSIKYMIVEMKGEIST